MREVAAWHETHHEVGAAGVAPVVVEGNDVRMLEAGDHLRLLLEPADEIRVGGKTRVNDLDRDVATDFRLHSAVD